MTDSLVINNDPRFTILVAPLDWGLGHATRCVPIINQLLQLGCKVIIAAEGSQETLLRTEFPTVTFVNIPGYRIRYTNSKRFFSLKIALQVPKILLSIYKERKWLTRFLEKNRLDAIISDNRYGLFNDKVTSVFITHQLLIKSSHLFIEKILQRINYSYIKNFAFCWVPDEKGTTNMAGDLSHPLILPKSQLRYIGGLSRLERCTEIGKTIDLLIILSGPEPQRSFLEKIMLNELKTFKGKVVMVRGLPDDKKPIPATGALQIVNHLSARELEKAMNESEYIISRSGYTTVMDICKLQKKSILIPTPGQNEQEYLATHLQAQQWALAATQENFSLEQALQKAKTFNYQLPDFKMDGYKKTVDEFLKEIEKHHFEQEI